MHHRLQKIAIKKYKKKSIYCKLLKINILIKKARKHLHSHDKLN